MTVTPEPAQTPPADPGGWQVPAKPVLEGLEAKWSARWAQDGTYAFVRPETRGEVFSIDTPPPTVSGSLHVEIIVFPAHPQTFLRACRTTDRKSVV